jgi:transcriptional regulator with XRE-family HTH domain
MLHERIKAVRHSLNLTQKEFGIKLGNVPRDTIANIEMGRIKIQPLFLQALCTTFSVNPTFLESGEGDMFLLENKNESEALRVFGSLIPELQDYTIQQMKALLELQNKFKGVNL